MAHEGNPPTVEQSLLAKGVDISLQSVRNALHDPRPEVRGLAANQLAEWKDTAAVPAIHYDLDHASTALERANLAEALLQLKDPSGKIAMRQLCNERGAGNFIRFYATRQLADAGDDGCTKAVLEMFSLAASSGVRQSAMEYLKLHPVVPPDQMSNLQVGLEHALQDEVPPIREEASYCIAFLKVSAARDSLKKAIAAETSESARRQMQADLDKLPSK